VLLGQEETVSLGNGHIRTSNGTKKKQVVAALKKGKNLKKKH
jgi:hypothetical protein